MRQIKTGSLMRIALIAIIGILLAACGGGDGDEEPTATSVPAQAQPTVEPTETASTPANATPDQTPPANTDMSSPDAIGTPEETGAATDVAATPPVTSSESSPDANAAGETPLQVMPATPASVDLTGEEDAGASPGATTAVLTGTPAPEGTVGANGAVTGDGTTGANLSTPDEDESGSNATPASVAMQATPAVIASPQASPASGTPVSAAQPLVVDSCDVADVPAFTGDVTTYVLSVDLNFRAGPGSDCDLIGDGPLGEFSDVDVIGGPVIREGDESPEWVEVQVGEQTGWLAWEYLEPAE